VALCSAPVCDDCSQLSTAGSYQKCVASLRVVAELLTSVFIGTLPMYERKESIASIWRVNLNCWTLKMEALPVPSQPRSPSCSPLQHAVLQSGGASQQNAAVVASEQVDAVWLLGVSSMWNRLCVCVCVCVCERERERATELCFKARDLRVLLLLLLQLYF
jgi:hypothetical protein